MSGTGGQRGSKPASTADYAREPLPSQREERPHARWVKTSSAGVPAGCREGVSPSLFESKTKGPISRAFNSSLKQFYWFSGCPPVLSATILRAFSASDLA
jgi:hypothetical protein